MKERLKKIKKKVKWILDVNNRYKGYKYRKSYSCDTEKKRIIFICGYPQGWNSLKTTYEAAKANENIKTVLIAWTGYKYNDIDAENFWREIDSEVLISSTDCIIDIEHLQPDLVFRQEPYDEVYPEQYSAKNILKIAKLCYIPYGYNPSPDIHLDIEYNDRFFNYCYAIFSDNNTVFDYCQKKKKNSKYYSNIKIFNYGFPRFDLLQDIRGKYDYRHYLWIPRWSLDSENNDKSNYFEYIDKLLEFFQNRPELFLTIRPHPAMYKNFIKRGVMSQNEVNDIKLKIRGIPNVDLDEQGDYIPSFRKADVLIADWSSLDVEFAVTSKPVIYCGRSSQFNKETRLLIEGFYNVNNWDEMREIINKLLNEEDPLKGVREKISDDFMNTIGTDIGKKIFGKCLEL